MHLSSHVHAVAIGPDVVFLDLREDAYLCLPDGQRQLRMAPDRRTLRPTAEAADRLRALGYAGAHPASVTPLPPPVRHDLLDAADAAPGARDALALVGCLADFVRFYAGRGLPQILEAASRRAPAGTPAVLDDELVDLVGRFRRGAVWLPVPSKCLVRSFLLLRFLHRRGRSATWVFGVRTWPFGAHCWLQVGEAALDEAADLAAEHTPIYALG